MKKGLYILLGIVICIVGLWVLAAAMGFLTWAAIITAIVVVVVALLRAKWGNEPEDISASVKETRRIEKTAEKALKELERKAEPQRIKN